jgi:hypothetical protein
LNKTPSSVARFHVYQTEHSLWQCSNYFAGNRYTLSEVESHQPLPEHQQVSSGDALRRSERTLKSHSTRRVRLERERLIMMQILGKEPTRICEPLGASHPSPFWKFRQKSDARAPYLFLNFSLSFLELPRCKIPLFSTSHMAPTCARDACGSESTLLRSTAPSS